MKFLVFLFTLILSLSAYGRGWIQDDDIKSSTELTASGATAASLPNDTKAWVTAKGINKTLYQAITDGNLSGGGGLTKTVISSSIAQTLGCDTENVVSATASSSSPVVLYVPATITPGCVINITSIASSGFVVYQSTSAAASQTISDSTGESATTNIVLAITDPAYTAYGSISLVGVDSNTFGTKSKNGVFTAAGVLAPSGLLAYWEADEVSGNLTGKWTAAYDLTQQGTVSQAFGKFNYSRGPFSDSNQFTQGGPAALRWYDNVTEIWFKTTNIGNTRNMFWENANATNVYQMQMYVRNTGAVACETKFNSTALEQITTATIYGDGQWHYAVCGNIAGIQRFYVDGALIASGGQDKNNGDIGGYLVIGRSNNTANFYFNGYIDSVAFWSQSGTGVTTWAEMEPYITKRWANGIGARYVR